MIPNEIIDQILDKVDIAEIISGYIPLKKSGQNFKARCPFHEEKTPSFMVSPAKQIYHCFGCGAGGNVIGFLMRHEKMDFVEAIKILAEKAGVVLPRARQTDGMESSLAEKLYAANNVACNFYQENLAKEFAKEANNYFIGRGASDRTMRQFRLGFAEDSWQSLFNHCRAGNIQPDILEKAGLVLQREDKSGWYDRFRNRVVFPIFDLRNRVLAFGARATDGSLPKYINSPETYIYRKGRHLYGLNLSKEYIKKQDYVVIVEGYFDLILPYQNEIRNIVATLGTALTVEQIRLLKRFTRNAIIVYDSDKAGQDAALRGLDLLIEEDMNVRIAILPKGTDPDSYVRKTEKAGFMKILKDSKDIFDYKLGTLTAKFKKTEPHGKARIAEEMLPTLSRIKNAVLKSSYLKKMAEALSIDEDSIRTELGKVKPHVAGAYPARTESDSKNRTQESLAEITLLAVAFEDPDCVSRIKKEIGFESFKNKFIAAVMEKIDGLNREGKKIIPSHLISHFNNNETEGVISAAMSLNQSMQDKERILEDCFRYIRKDNLKTALADMQLKIKEAQSSSDMNRINKLIADYNELMKEYRKEETNFVKAL